MNTAKRMEQIAKLKECAKLHGLDVRFRSTPNNLSDFCIYIYDRNFRQSNAIVFEGMNGGGILNFKNCLKNAYRWIEKRDKRFTFLDGRWQYRHYHLIVWKDRKVRELDYHLTIKGADKAAAEYVKQGCCVICYDQPPTGKSKLVKVYGDHERHCNDYIKKGIRIFKYKNGDYGTKKA